MTIHLMLVTYPACNEGVACRMFLGQFPDFETLYAFTEKWSAQEYALLDCPYALSKDDVYPAAWDYFEEPVL